jgi:hypothetical protein
MTSLTSSSRRSPVRHIRLKSTCNFQVRTSGSLISSSFAVPWCMPRLGPPRVPARFRSCIRLGAVVIVASQCPLASLPGVPPLIVPVPFRKDQYIQSESISSPFSEFGSGHPIIILSRDFSRSPSISESLAYCHAALINNFPSKLQVFPNMLHYFPTHYLYS